MSIRNVGIKKIINFGFLSALILFSNSAFSNIFNVNAEYKPAVYDAEYGANNFKNTDVCNLDEHLCKVTYDNEYIYTFPVLFSRTPRQTGSNRDKPIFFNVKPKKVMLTNKINGKQYEMELIPTIIGLYVGGFRGFSSVEELGASAFKVEGDCIYKTSRGRGYPSKIRVVYRTKGEVMTSGCYVGFKERPQDGVQLQTTEVYFGFRLKTPNPLKMPNGPYFGLLDLSISPQGDIDLGNGSYSAYHTLIFQLSVKHQIDVFFPYEKQKIKLKPNYGWDLGGKNTILSTKIPYWLYASSNVKLSIRCQYKFNDACGIKNNKNHLVGLDVFNITEENKKTLLTEKHPELITVATPQKGKKNEILFRVNNGSVTSMLHYPGSFYSGDVTFIYDADL
ncbi:hypothetical protein FXE62_15060 [Vibrio cholerae]|uniref:hypothetical protein n=1 Tax=Vibrio cholerae TaxID=666 RepID=UPI0011D6F4F4|nr:hypothetical protein [Vibrio cholerae]TXZ02602.1 hypothetical protein FXE62_15060 [Vibrio cholerae]GHY13419.1 hypothetical protein VCSRO69_0645 [Vibrio cholerae]